MYHDEAAHQRSNEQVERPLEERGDPPTVERSGAATSAAHGNERSGLDTLQLMERIVEGGNLRRALKRVQQNKGRPGVDGLTGEALTDPLRAHWPAIRELHRRGVGGTVLGMAARFGRSWWHVAAHKALAPTSSHSACRAWAPPEPQLTEPPDADPHVRWCGREVGEIFLSYSPSRSFPLLVCFMEPAG